MFRGHSERNLDPKGRLMLPPEFREEVLASSPEGKLMLTNFDGCVVGYPMPEWERIEKSFQGINVLDKRIRNLQRFLISGAVEVVLDKQGRILIPPYLRSYAKLDKDCVLAGVATKFELWDKETFEARRRETEETFDADMADLAASGFELRL
ncbi:Transcriptional regulator MraZ [Fundidesulfovibrio magnetotacticus]|uniref:Transcriptional regulator MraZ n=1 Tax=Fundidesulfovibrio magnetotacticus TaxID=2730080 RepID=A0A6V8LRG0_9BACT|nr:division/cell wall cluster transcriptional repressor MraZ [Fundidesulfovibrio magnetotacticus]GFK93560.1 Transcriptional regulator MraZ [Fundidesulfovibrio magnetotacticus]